jgi:peroxiredoxin Q/BCP
VLGVSPDSLETHRKFSEEHGITFPLISDTDNTIRGLYERGRITFLIDKTGIIRYVQKGVPEIGKFLREIKSLKE